MKTLPYPLRAASFALRFHPFAWGFHAVHKKDLSEAARAGGCTVWWVRCGCLTLSYSRML